MVAKHEIKRTFWHKNYVFLLSVVSTLTGTAAMWSAHKYEYGYKMKIDDLRRLFQKDHDLQIDAMILQEYENEPDEFKESTIMDITGRKQ